MTSTHLRILAAIAAHPTFRLYDFHLTDLRASLEEVRWLSFRKFIQRKGGPTVGHYWVLTKSGRAKLNGGPR